MSPLLLTASSLKPLSYSPPSPQENRQIPASPASKSKQANALPKVMMLGLGALLLAHSPELLIKTAKGIAGFDALVFRGNLSHWLTLGQFSGFKGMSDYLDHVVKTDHHATSSRTQAFLHAGTHAVWNHRIAHWLEKNNFKAAARWYMERSKRLTGIEIHPGAKLGQRVTFDHFGTVIGQTAEVGNDVHFVGGVVLGGNPKKGEFPRHPIVGNNIMFGFCAKVVGRITIKDGCKVGLHATLFKDLPPDTTTVGFNGIIRWKGQHLNKRYDIKDVLALEQEDKLDSITKKTTSP